jgi:hypothetical protein
MVVNQDWIGEAESPYTVCDLLDLFARMSTRVSPIGLKVAGRDLTYDRRFVLLFKASISSHLISSHLISSHRVSRADSRPNCT